MAESSHPHPLNTPGDWYVVEGGCEYCMGPQGTAPELMAMAPDSTACDCCYFAKQPETERDVEDAIAAMQSSTCRNLRYRGTDPAILRKLIAAGCGYACDHAQSKTGADDHSEPQQQPATITSRLRGLFKR